jgi:hypothetical protein
MKKTLLIVAVLSITVLTLGVAGYAYAQDQTLEYPYGPDMMGDYDGYGHGMMGDFAGYGHGMMGVNGGYGMMGWNGEEGPMHDAMVSSLADALELSPDEIDARHDAGETLWEIAEAEGLSAEEIQELMFSAHYIALEDAVANGWLTQEQAEWMDAHMEQMWDGGSHCGGGGDFGTGGRRGGMNW